MRVVILISPLCAPAEFALNKFLKSSHKEINIVGIIISDIQPLKQRFWKHVFYGLRRSGLFYGFLVGLVGYFHLIGLLIASIIYWWRRRQWLSIAELIDKYDLKAYYTEDINSSESIRILNNWKPDILVSLYFDQILKSNVISIPKVAAINMHPGLLPGYRGVWPGFWKLYKNEKQAGITIHYIDENIDSGEILDQYQFDIDKNDSRLALALKAANFGAKRLATVLKNFKDGIKMHPIKKIGKSKYRSLPKKKHFEKFYKKGGRLFDLFADLKKIITLSFNLNAFDQSSIKSSKSSNTSDSSKPSNSS